VRLLKNAGGASMNPMPFDYRFNAATGCRAGRIMPAAGDRAPSCRTGSDIQSRSDSRNLPASTRSNHAPF
jgi:hypothetical protein